jgi:hypothetical protein
MQLIDVYYQTFIWTCFGHHYAHHQENKSVHCRIWCSALVVMAVVMWSWDASCVHCESYCSTAHNHSHHNQSRTPYAAVHTLVLLMMGIMMPETCWDKSLIINIWLVASCWSLSLHPKLYNMFPCSFTFFINHENTFLKGTHHARAIIF